jgi:hypothetical protein
VNVCLDSCEGRGVNGRASTCSVFGMVAVGFDGPGGVGRAMVRSGCAVGAEIRKVGFGRGSGGGSFSFACLCCTVAAAGIFASLFSFRGFQADTGRCLPRRELLDGARYVITLASGRSFSSVDLFSPTRLFSKRVIMKLEGKCGRELHTFRVSSSFEAEREETPSVAKSCVGMGFEVARAASEIDFSDGRTSVASTLSDVWATDGGGLTSS